jgi:hypothetical protein
MRRRGSPPKHRVPAAAAPLASARPEPFDSGAAARALRSGQARSRGDLVAPVRAPVRAGQKLDVQLAWALDRDGQKVHVARLDPRDRRGRGPFRCMACDEPLVPHLGRVRARHFAHFPGSSCPLTAPETALHLDAKERLLGLCADAFAGRRRVTVLARCPACRRPAPRDLGAEGDAAVAEGAVGPLRADVLVLAAGAPRLAFEVKVTHAVDPEKEAALLAAGVPAVEVDAREEWLVEEGDETRVVVARSLAFRPCGGCEARARGDVDRGRGGEAAELAELEAYRARGLFGPTTARPRVVGASPPLPAAPLAGEARPEIDAPLSSADRAELADRFACPECGGRELAFGERIARHPCPGKGERPVAWRGYDGSMVELSWWRRAQA